MQAIDLPPCVIKYQNGVFFYEHIEGGYKFSSPKYTHPEALEELLARQFGKRWRSKIANYVQYIQIFKNQYNNANK